MYQGLYQRCFTDFEHIFALDDLREFKRNNPFRGFFPFLNTGI